jgi:hypothetical protein
MGENGGVVKHVIEMWESGDRDYWECDCGRSGSARAGDGEFAAEKHVAKGDQVSYRHSGGLP